MTREDRSVDREPASVSFTSRHRSSAGATHRMRSEWANRGSQVSTRSHDLLRRNGSSIFGSWQINHAPKKGDSKSIIHYKFSSECVGIIPHNNRNIPVSAVYTTAIRISQLQCYSPQSGQYLSLGVIPHNHENIYHILGFIYHENTTASVLFTGHENILASRFFTSALALFTTATRISQPRGFSPQPREYLNLEVIHHGHDNTSVPLLFTTTTRILQLFTTATRIPQLQGYSKCL
ncbi:hypothetical protein J6590_052131 [Homalodisca vitripennis]|nr:hypothetical protein J6590_052131 [Homalodisca vitripennis]